MSLLDRKYKELIAERIQKAQLALKVEKGVEMVNAHLEGERLMSEVDVKVVTLVFKHNLPILKQIEHSTQDAPTSREKLIERITELHARATGQSQRGAANGTATADADAEVRH